MRAWNGYTADKLSIKAKRQGILKKIKWCNLAFFHWSKLDCKGSQWYRMSPIERAATAIYTCIVGPKMDDLLYCDCPILEILLANQPNLLFFKVINWILSQTEETDKCAIIVSTMEMQNSAMSPVSALFSLEKWISAWVMPGLRKPKHSVYMCNSFIVSHSLFNC